LVAGFFGMLVPMYQTIRLRFPYGWNHNAYLPENFKSHTDMFSL
jgi:hypothetical protein